MPIEPNSTNCPLGRGGPSQVIAIVRCGSLPSTEQMLRARSTEHIVNFEEAWLSKTSSNSSRDIEIVA